MQILWNVFFDMAMEVMEPQFIAMGKMDVEQ